MTEIHSATSQWYPDFMSTRSPEPRQCSIRLPRPLWISLWTLSLAGTSFLAVNELDGQPPREPPKGDAVIRAPAGLSEIVITTTSRLAGAIHSLTWNGKEFIDSADHGRQLQSAANYDLGKPFFPEVFNPTEAGSRRDGAGETSSSRLLSLKATGHQLETTTQMAFWLVPGEESEGHPAYNENVLSDHRLAKRVVIGHKELPYAIEYDVTFTIPAEEKHTLAQFEALTGYMPAEFEKFWTFDPDTGNLLPLDDGPGEQSKPLVFSTADQQFAMGVIASEPPPPGSAGPGYGRFRFRAEKVVKWNCVYRVRNLAGVRPGEYRYRMFVAVGTRDIVRETLKSLASP
jgi:hypothetical protein